MKPALTTLLATSSMLSLSHAQIDLNGDGLGDLWQLRYQLANAAPTDDTDGDGMSNVEENIAGTDPLDPASSFACPEFMTSGGTTGSVNWDGVAGKEYFLEGSPLLAGWQAEMTPLISNGGAESASVSTEDSARFWRVGVRNADRDGDGLTDAEEIMLGFNPTDPNSASPGGSATTAGGDLAKAVTMLTSSGSFSLDGVNVQGTAPTNNDASRFLTQAAMGATAAEISAMESSNYEAWIEDQFTKTLSQMGPEIANRRALELDVFDNHKRHAWWRQFLTGDDVLRHRIAFALSQIYVISDTASLDPYGMSTYYDLLLKNSFGNIRTLLQDVTRFPDENYAREVMQLFTIGLFELNPDGTRVQDTEGNDIPTYTNEDVTNFARVFTGMSYGGDSNSTSNINRFFWGERNFNVPMKLWEQEHDRDAKTLLNGVTLPAYDDNSGRTGMDDVTAALDNLFNHPSTGPFLSRLFIQRLVTSNPSPGYIQRVAMAFADDGNGVRGNMKAIIKAILLDPEARTVPDSDTSGRLREPFVRYARLGRIFTARSTTDTFLINNWSVDSDLGQRWMSSPSVFNFYLPDHRPNGPLADLDLNAPEYQILTAVTAISSQNYYRWKFQGQGLTQPWTPAEEKVSFQWDAELALTSDPIALIEHLDGLIAAGQLSSTTKATIVTAVSNVSANNPDDRLEMAMRLIYLSPDFAVFR